MTGPYTFATRTDCFGIPKALDAEIEYEFDWDGEICISALILKQSVNYNSKGEYAPHTEELRISADWLSNSTLNDLVTEIHDDLVADAVDAAFEAKRDCAIHHFFDSRASGPVHYTGKPVV